MRKAPALCSRTFRAPAPLPPKPALLGLSEIAEPGLVSFLANALCQQRVKPYRALVLSGPKPFGVAACQRSRNIQQHWLVAARPLLDEGERLACRAGVK